MERHAYRKEPRHEDMAAVSSILKESGFFNVEEQEIGVSLVAERLEKGPASGYFFQFAEWNSAVVGYTCFGPIPGTRSSYDLYWIAVASSIRGRGLGSDLLVESERRIAEDGGTRVYVETSSSDLYRPTRAFYRKCGYTLEATLQDYYAPGDGKCLYVKILSSNMTEDARYRP